MKVKPGILFQNDSLLAMDKPPGLLSVPDRHHDDKPSLAAMVLGQFPSARPLHRIDFETSGVLLFCLRPEAFGFYSDQFENRQIIKKYMVITEGRCSTQEGWIDQPLFTQNIGKVLISKRGKSSQTHWTLLEKFLHHSFLEVHPLTGRTHQIRVHLASIGHPVAVDSVYGSGRPLLLSNLKGKKQYRLSKDAETENPLLSRLALHASSISLNLYETGESMTINSPLPKDMVVALVKLRQYTSALK